jgi:cytochrome c
MRWIFAVMAGLALAACDSGDTGTDTATNDGAPTAQSTAPADEIVTIDLSALPAPYNAADWDAGRRQFRRCGSCHTVAANGGNRVGPNLHGMFGREVGTAANFDYSAAMENADFVWTPEQLNAWLANPREFLPGNRMSFVGLRNEDDRVNVIAYLLLETDSASAD